jgi:hypothetical protein
MAKHTITHKCGHAVVHNITGPMKNRPWQVERLKGQVCRECYIAGINEAAAVAAAEQGLPRLTGSEKQVAWATTIRDELLGRCEGWIKKTIEMAEGKATDEDLARFREETGKALETLKSKTSASWWIDHRGDSSVDLINGVLQ